MKILSYIALPLLLMGCANNKPQAPEQIPMDEISAYREAVITLSGYIALDDSAYHLTITKEHASSLGVPEKYYDRIQQDLDYTNHIVNEEYNKKGIPIEMTEYTIAPDF